MIAGLSPLMESTGGIAGEVEAMVHGVPEAVGSVEEVEVAGDGFAKDWELDCLNRAVSWALVTHTGAGSLGPSVTHSFCVSGRRQY